MVTFTHKGDFSKITQFFNSIMKKKYISILQRYGELGVSALAAATPKDTGKTAESWRYVITEEADKITISFENDNVNNGVNIALILNYGHGTGNGGYVAGREYIEPAIAPIMDKLADAAWKEVTSV